MANEQNLKPLNTLAKSEQRKIQKKGGKARAEQRRERKLMKERLELALDKKIKTKEGEIDSLDAITIKLIEQAMKGNVKAYTVIRDTLGQAPIQKLQVNEVDPEVIKKVDELVDECLCEDADKPSE